jgi:uncharacterized protein YbaR (Trm112 family)
MHQHDRLSMLRCPEDRSELSAAGEDVINKINTAIRRRQLSNRAGRRLEETIDGGLIRAEGDVLYPIIDRIPVLLRDEGIRLDQLD